jgi:hypothetical protein
MLAEHLAADGGEIQPNICRRLVQRIGPTKKPSSIWHIRTSCFVWVRR